MVLGGSNRWGDDDDDYLPSRTETPADKNGVRTIIEWKFDDQNNKVKVTKRVKSTTRVTKTSKNVLERRNWNKFGKAAAPDADESNVTYAAGEDVTLDDPNADVIIPGEKKEEESIFAGVKNSSIVVCRTCGMVGHWTLKCPYKFTPPDQIPTDAAAQEAESNSGTGATSDKYVAPGLRGLSAGSGGRDLSSIEVDRDNATLRVTNISTDANEDDIRELFAPFGPLSRVFLAKDRETMVSRGFAFVSYQYKADAETALRELQGFGYDHLILKLEWAKPSTRQPSDEGGMGGTTFRSGYGKALPQNMAPSAKQ